MLDRLLLIASYACAVAWLAFHLAAPDHLTACLDVSTRADCEAWQAKHKE